MTKDRIHIACTVLIFLFVLFNAVTGYRKTIQDKEFIIELQRTVLESYKCQ